MAISSSTQWHVRTGGSELNGGGFDPTISGAGTNYTDQDAAQLSLSDLTTSGASATVGSVTGGFTSAMIGNCLRIASGTNFTPGYYFVVSVGSTNAATLDRACSTGSGSGGVGRLGGAHASLKSYANGGSGGSPILTTPLDQGHAIFKCGSGNNNPTSIDYDYTAGYWTFPGGGDTGPIYLIGYNGRPFIGHVSVLAWNWVDVVVMNICAKNVLGYYADGVFNSSRTYSYNCRYDVNGMDATVVRGSIHGCEIKNSGSTSAGTTAALVAQNGVTITQSHIHDVRGDGIIGYDLCGYSIEGNVIRNCGGNGLTLQKGDGQSFRSSVFNNTIADNVGHGVSTAADPRTLCLSRNLITGHSGSGKYGVNYTGSGPTGGGFSKALCADNNFYGNTANANFTLDASNTTLNPSYVGSGDYTPTNTALLIPYVVGNP